jgi:hypothetical protein
MDVEVALHAQVDFAVPTGVGAAWELSIVDQFQEFLEMNHHAL